MTALTLSIPLFIWSALSLALIVLTLPTLATLATLTSLAALLGILALTLTLTTLILLSLRIVVTHGNSPIRPNAGKRNVRAMP